MRYIILWGWLWLLAGPAHAQISADHWNGGAVRVGPSSTVCGTGAEGAIRYNSVSNALEFCNGTAWMQSAQVQGGQPPTAPAGSGYFVLTETAWDGNLGGRAGANGKCLTELTVTHTDWAGYGAANANGQLTAGKVRAFLCDGPACNNLIPLTTYYFARAGNAAAGGASLTSDENGRAPNNSSIWSAANYFSGNHDYWTGRTQTGHMSWANDPYHHCGGFLSNSSAFSGTIGNSGNTNYYRWHADNPPCNNSNRLICFVDP